MLDMRDEIQEVNIEEIQFSPYQPRKVFDYQELEDLAQSIKSVGLLQPPVVRQLSINKFELIAGERRLRAAKIAGLKKIPVIMLSLKEEHCAEAALIENLQRVDLNPMEIAYALKRLVDNFFMHQNDLAEKVGKKRSTIANYLRLLSLPKTIQESVSKNEITMGHAKVILSLEDEEKQRLLHEMIIRDKLTVRETEIALKRISDKVKSKNLKYTNRDFHLEFLAEKIQQKLGTKVMIDGQGKKGRIVIHYYNLDDLDRLLKGFGLELL